MGTKGGGWTPSASQGPEGDAEEEGVALDEAGGGRRSSEVEEGPPMKTGARAR
jgi:hypothetical protein